MDLAAGRVEGAEAPPQGVQDTVTQGAALVQGMPGSGHGSHGGLGYGRLVRVLGEVQPGGAAPPGNVGTYWSAAQSGCAARCVLTVTPVRGHATPVLVPCGPRPGGRRQGQCGQPRG